jgi:hypothetical protein
MREAKAKLKRAKVLDEEEEHH